MRGTTNFSTTAVTGNAFPAAEANDFAAQIAGSDDDVLYDLIDLEPPAAATSTNVNVGFIALRNGPLVTPHGSGRRVVVAPLRVIRSSTDNALPRALVSGILSADTQSNTLTAPTGGKWGFDLLYAQLAYVDSADPSKGTVVTLNWAPSPTYVIFASAAPFAVLPSNTSTTWNIPLKWVRNVAGVSLFTQEDIIDIAPPVVSSVSGNLRRTISSKLSGVSVRRAYSSANNDPTALVTGGASAYTTGSTNILTSTITPPTVARTGGELVLLEVVIAKEITGGNAGATTRYVVDDSRDWRKGNFKISWCIDSQTTLRFGEDSTNTATASARQMPTNFASGASLGNANYTTYGQTFESNVALSALVAGVVSRTNQPADNSMLPFLAAGDAVWFEVGSTAPYALKFCKSIAGAGAGGSIYARVEAIFPNGR